jgi:ribosomal protein L4
MASKIPSKDGILSLPLLESGGRAFAPQVEINYSAGLPFESI